MNENEKNKPFVVTLLRHGESVGNAESRWQGQADFPLTRKGRAQAQALAERWQKEKKAVRPCHRQSAHTHKRDRRDHCLCIELESGIRSPVAGTR